MPPSLEPLSPPSDAGGAEDFTGHSSKPANLMHTEVKSPATGWLDDAWRLWARTTEHHDTSR